MRQQQLCGFRGDSARRVAVVRLCLRQELRGGRGRAGDAARRRRREQSVWLQGRARRCPKLFLLFFGLLFLFSSQPLAGKRAGFRPRRMLRSALGDVPRGVHSALSVLPAGRRGSLGGLGGGFGGGGTRRRRERENGRCRSRSCPCFIARARRGLSLQSSPFVPSSASSRSPSCRCLDLFGEQRLLARARGRRRRLLRCRPKEQRRRGCFVVVVAAAAIFLLYWRFREAVAAPAGAAEAAVKNKRIFFGVCVDSL